VGRNRRRTSRQAKHAENWLGPDEAARSRPWAYEELLFQPAGDAGGELDSLASDLALELAELKRMQNDLHDQVVRVAELEGRIQALRHLRADSTDGAGVGSEAHVELRSLPSDPALPRALDRARSLARCEGYQVEAPEGLVGYVEGLRFVSRIDEPDLLEVRGGRFGRDLVLIPVEAVEEVIAEEERVVVRAMPAAVQDNHEHELVSLLRRALRHDAD
jgi:hypothetical protein